MKTSTSIFIGLFFGLFVSFSSGFWACSPPAGQTDTPQLDAGGPDASGNKESVTQETTPTENAPQGGTTHLILEYPKDGKWNDKNFYRMPYPNDLRIEKDGSPNLTGLPQPKRTRKCAVPDTNIPLVKQFLGSIEPDKFIAERLALVDKHTRGFGLYSAIYFQFTDTLAKESIPSPAKSMEKDAQIFLMDIDPKSKYKGTRIPISIHPGYASRFFPAPMVAIRPFEGFPLQAGTRYAVVFRKGVKDSKGKAIVAPPKFEELASEKKLSDAGREALRSVYAPMFAYLKKDHSIAPSDIIAATVFTTGKPLADMREIYKMLQTLTVKPPKLNCFDPGSKYTYYRCNGTYEAPQFQKGNPPFFDLDTGFFVKKDGKFQYRFEKLRFVLTVPHSYISANKPPVKIPIVIYSHGTGGDYETPINNNIASQLADLGIAVISIDQPLHGERVGLAIKDAGWLFFNPLNFMAARDNPRQAAIDYIWLKKLTASLDIKVVSRQVSFPKEKIWFMGHSQGALVGALFTGIEQDMRAAFLSAPSGALINTFLPAPNRPKDHPNNVTPYVGYLLCDNPDVKIDEFHPLPNLLQHLYDPADPVNYAPHILDKERQIPLNLFMTQGTRDTYTPPQVFRPVATAIQAPLLGTEHQAILGLKLRGVAPQKLPAKGNYTYKNGKKATIGFTQHVECKRTNGTLCDGHFVTFHNRDAQTHWISFFESLLKNEVPEIK